MPDKLAMLARRLRGCYRATTMKTINIENALHREPFKAFLLRLDHGKDIKVEHPELVLFTPSKATAVVVEGEHVHVIDVEHVNALSY